MSALTREDIRSVLGPVDDMLAAELAATNATAGELREAYAWVTGDDALIDELRPLPKGRVAELTEILQAQLVPDDEP